MAGQRMSDYNLHYRHLMLYQFHKGNNAAKATKEICKIYGSGAISVRTVQKWFKKFHKKDFNLKDDNRSGRPTEVNDNQLLELIESNPHYTSRQISEILKVSKSVILLHLERHGMISKCNVWVPAKINDEIRIERKHFCDLLLNRCKNEDFLKNLITGAGKRIIYQNVEENNVMLYVWWNYKGLLYYEIILNQETINSDQYCLLLDRLKLAIDKKHSTFSNDLVFYHNKSISLQSEEKIKQFGWDLIRHPSLSPDLAPSDFHLFRAFQNSLNGKNFDDIDSLKNYVKQFFDTKTENFFSDGIFQLKNRWQKVIDQNGEYINE